MIDSGRPPAGATRAEMTLWNQKNMTRTLMCAQFGALPGSVLQRIDACTDPAKLEAAREQLDQLSSPEELEL